MSLRYTPTIGGRRPHLDEIQQTGPRTRLHKLLKVEAAGVEGGAEIDEDSGVAIFEEYLVAADGVGAVVDGDDSRHASVLRTVRPSPLPFPQAGEGRELNFLGGGLVHRRLR